MRILGILFRNWFFKSKWEEIKKTDTIYPEHSISILRLKTESGKLATGWIDKAYKDYRYKKYCLYNFLIMVDLTDEIAQSNQELDMGTIEDYFVNELRNICIAHIVARVATDKGFNIEMYLEDDDAAVNHLRSILDNPSRIVSFNCEVNIDPKWDAVSGLMDR